jgi:site-specific DNA recombinase
VQTVLEAHRNGEKQREHPHYLKSSVFCGACGNRLIVHNAKNRYGVNYPYFICLGRHQKLNDCTRKAILIETVEGLIEDRYLTVQLAPDLRERLERLLSDELGLNRAAAEVEELALTKQRARLLNERAKLLQAHYARAVPVDLLKAEQDRIGQALDGIESRLSALQTKFDLIEANLKVALNFASDCHRAYVQASDHVRRRFNQAFFTHIYVDEDTVRTELAEPFRMLLSVSDAVITRPQTQSAPQSELGGHRGGEPDPLSRTP